RPSRAAGRTGRSLRWPLDRWGQSTLGLVPRRQLSRTQQRGHRARVGPVAVVDPGEQAALRDVVVEHVGDLELAAAGRGEVVDDLEGVRSEEVDADRDKVGLRLLRLLLEAHDPTIAIELRDAEPF